MEKKRSDAVTLISVYHFLMAGIIGLAFCGLIGMALFGIASVSGYRYGYHVGIPFSIMALGLLIAGVLIVAHVVVGWGLLKMRPWARWAGIVMGILAIPNFPLGTAAGIFSIWYLLTPEAEDAFAA